MKAKILFLVFLIVLSGLYRYQVIFALNTPESTDVANLTAKAEGGDTQSQYLLGLHYSKTGDKQDKVKAYMWLHVAVEQGYSQAVYPRYEISTTMTQDEIAEAKRLASKHIVQKETAPVREHKEVGNVCSICGEPAVFWCNVRKAWFCDKHAGKTYEPSGGYRYRCR